jgi:predicted nucleic acid-binding protein
MTAIFVDTNIFVYARDTRDRVKHERARACVDEMWQSRQGRTSIQVLCEYYTVVTRTLSAPYPSQEAWAHVRALLAWSPQPTNEALLHLARQVESRFKLGWWDSLILAAAELQGCEVVLSEDFQDGGKYGGITVHNPLVPRARQALAPYAVSSPAPLHRGRGRPRKVVSAGR